MKQYLLPLLILLSFTLSAQPAVYQHFEVDSAAEPRGGMLYLGTFLQTNLRKPIEAEANGIGGRVILSAIVEPNGRVSDVKVTKSLRPDCDQEAVRVFSLFGAWQPAYKGGKVVRQFVNIPVTFKPNAPFPFVNSARISYYDAKQQPLADSSELAQYKQVTPFDANGIPSGNVIIFQRKRQEWKEYSLLPFARRKSGRSNASGKSIFTIGVQRADRKWQGRVFDIDETGVLVRQSFYANGELAGSELEYHPDGIVTQRTDYVDTLKAITSWYPTGQIKQVWTIARNRRTFTSNPEQVTAFWDSSGRQLVNEGNGAVTYIASMKSLSDTTRQTEFIEQGAYVAGLKQGRWTGRYADGSHSYEEEYDKGICQGGKAVTAGSDTVRYTVREQMPEFKGGMQGLGQFLSQNLRYPVEAQRARVQGQVFVSFVVCTDGTLCDYEVLKSVDKVVDQEALRVVKAMSGRWKPGYQRGQPVRVKYNLPINFTLE